MHSQGNCTPPPTTEGADSAGNSSSVAYQWSIQPGLVAAASSLLSTGTGSGVFPLGLAASVLVVDAAAAVSAMGQYVIALKCFAEGAEATAALVVQVGMFPLYFLCARCTLHVFRCWCQRP